MVAVKELVDIEDNSRPVEMDVSSFEERYSDAEWAQYNDQLATEGYVPDPDAE